MEVYSIYKATNLIDGKIYIGKTEDLNQRKINHHSAAYNDKNKSYNDYFHRAIRLYDKENFKWETLYHTLDEDYSYEMEKYFIKEYNTYTKIKGSWGYNMTPGGESPPSQKGISKTEEHKKKIGLSHLGMSCPEEVKRKISETKKGILVNPLLYTYIITFPDGHEEIIKNLAKFCREHNLNGGHMNEVLKGKRNHNKGFKVRYLESVI